MPERYPYPYPDPEDRKSSYRKLAVPDKHLVICTVEGDSVYIECVPDCRQDCRWLL